MDKSDKNNFLALYEIKWPFWEGEREIMLKNLLPFDAKIMLNGCKKTGTKGQLISEWKDQIILPTGTG